MNAQEIRSLIEQKIAGQGTNVDAGGALPLILEALVDALEESKPVVIEILDTGLTTEPISDFLENMKIDGEPATEEKLLSLSLEKGPIICKCGGDILNVIYLYSVSSGDARQFAFVAGGTDIAGQPNIGGSYSLNIDFITGITSAAYREV